MAETYLEYQLDNGFIKNWLVAGPYQRPVQVSGLPDEAQDQMLSLAREMQDKTTGYSEPPVDRTEFAYAGEKVMWRYYRCGVDALVDVSQVYPVWKFARTWAHARLMVTQPAPVTFSLSVTGPATVWLNGKQVFEVEGFPGELRTAQFQVELDQENDLLVRFDQLGVRSVRNQMSLQALDHQSDISVRLETKARYPYRHQQFEAMLEKAYLEEVANVRGNIVDLRWAEDTTEELHYGYQIQDAEERIYIDGSFDPDLEKPLDIGHPQRIFERQMWVVLHAPNREYYELENRYERRLPIYIMDNEYTQQPYGEYATRRMEALYDAAKREGNLYAEIAKMALEKWNEFDSNVLLANLERVKQGDAGSAALVAGLLSIAYRFMETSGFPKKLREPLEDALMGFRYGVEEAAKDAVDFHSESQRFLLAACELLAGQRYPKRAFPNSGMTGLQHQQKAEKVVLDWLSKRGRGGFIEWDSNSAFEVNITALSLLTSLAKNETVRELSAVLLDKILFLMAVNSFEGSYGTTHGATGAAMIKSAKLEATSALNRLLWGMGVYSQYIMGTVSLACSDYEFPSFFADMAAYPPEELWSKERHTADLDVPGAAEVNKVLYKTPDGMLSSAQDYRPGEKGSREHIWQATLGPDAVVFANHPACVGDTDAQQPGFWLGNAVLPRVAQWKNVLIAVHNLPEDDRMGFTHAWFPVYQFDEYEISNGWAFARKGQGFVALTAQQGIELVKHAPDGFRELRSYGRNNVWICQMGRQSVDGDFSAFKNKVLQNAPGWGNLSTSLTGVRGETISFGWNEPLRVNGAEQPLSGYKHIDNLYCQAELPANQMDVQYEDILMRLNFQ
jgi:hypothetical protein